MAGLSDLVGVLLQGGLTSSSANRVENALGQSGLGHSGGLLEQVLGGASGGTAAGGGMLGGLMQTAKNMFGSQQNTSLASNPLATGGLGALAGALFGGGSKSVKGALGGGAMAMLAGLAFQAFTNRNKRPDGIQPALYSNTLPLGVRAAASPEEDQELESQAAVVLRGMINAAKADGAIDQAELEKIVGRMKEIGTDDDTQRWVMDELGRPADFDRLVNEIPNEAVAAQVYLASLFAIEVDTEAEINYLRQLAQRTGLDNGIVQQLHEMVGLT